MKTIRVLFYKSGEYDSLFSRAISKWSKFWNPSLKTLPDYSHAELNFFEQDSKWDDDGRPDLCFSSATRGDFTGVRFTRAGEVLKNPERWDFIDIAVEDRLEQLMFDEAKKLIGRKYDYLAILGFCLPWRIQDSGRWYCSEAVNQILWLGDVIDRPYRYSPLASAGMLLKKGFKIRNLVSPQRGSKVIAK